MIGILEGTVLVPFVLKKASFLNGSLRALLFWIPFILKVVEGLMSLEGILRQAGVILLPL